MRVKNCGQKLEWSKLGRGWEVTSEKIETSLKQYFLDINLQKVINIEIVQGTHISFPDLPTVNI